MAKVKKVAPPEPVEDDSHAFASREETWPEDQALRRAGFIIAHRKKGRMPQWWAPGDHPRRLVNHRDALELARTLIVVDPAA